MSCPVVHANVGDGTAAGGGARGGEGLQPPPERALHDRVENLCERAARVVDECRVKLVEEKNGVGDCQEQAQRLLQCEDRRRQAVAGVLGPDHKTILSAVQACTEKGTERDECVRRAHQWAGDIWSNMGGQQ